ncbi:MAG: hypothetical protein VW057_02350 [Rhodospirillaceae bacterium]
MPYSFDDFCSDGRAALAADQGAEGRESIRIALERLLSDTDFIAQYLGSGAPEGMHPIYQDPEYDFMVLTYKMPDPRTSPPHDHGDSWAIYGQVSKHTDMTVWQHVDSESEKLEVVRSYRLNPGMAGVYHPGDIHSIDYPAGSTFVRVTGTDLSKVARKVFDPETEAVKVVESVGTGNKN